jgi:thiamine-phosphate pyrophosphorylase
MAESGPPCRLYLPLPAIASPKLDERLAQAGIYAGSLLLGGGDSIDENWATQQIDLAHERNLACLIEGDAALARKIGADGVHIDADVSAYLAARELLGKEASIGVACGLNRHKAMQLAEIGADYVAFGEDSTGGGIDAVDQCAELIAWWAEIFVVPCVAWNVDSIEDAARFAKLGADFVAPSREIWRTDDALARIAEMDRAIAGGRKAA